ncbi:MAG: Rid family detoxifying hydrolase [Armatimonas sp.]
MQKSAVFSQSGPLAGAPYTPAVRAQGELLFISGQLGLDPETKQPYEDFAAQVEGAIAGLKGLVEAAGGTLDNIVKTTVFLSGDMTRFPVLNEIYARHFNGEVRPARSTFAVAALPAGALVEIEAIAVL